MGRWWMRSEGGSGGDGIKCYWPKLKAVTLPNPQNKRSNSLAEQIAMI